MKKKKNFVERNKQPAVACVIREFASRDWKKPREISVVITALGNKIWTRDLINAEEEY
jgi:hypothetical protein